ncbi:MAG: BON domain-containing protein [Gallionellaceae bacterium]|nr:BON domain-containing protein [Gallionellaceae bacterium]
MRYLVLALITVFIFTAQGCAGFAKKSAADRRTAGTQIEDSTIEKTSIERIQEKYKDTSQITITSYNRFVLIAGDALSEDIKTEVERIVRTVPNVKKTANEVVVGALRDSAARRTDASITSNIKSRLGKNKSVQTATFQVATSRGIVYLLGLTTHAEANVAADIASTTADVKQVVKVFEYID